MMMKTIEIFCASNPFRIDEALWTFLDGRDFSNDIIFLPSRRAVRSVERMIVEKTRCEAVILPKLIALGEGTDDFDDEEYSHLASRISHLERIIVLSKLLSASNENSIAQNLPVARDLVRMMDYIENENADANINWSELVDEKYAEHFRDKAKFLDIAQKALPLLFPGRQTIAQMRNKDIRSWIKTLEVRSSKFEGRVIVCGSTGSVPATQDLMAHVAGLPNGIIILPGKISGIRYQEPGVSNPYYAELQFLKKINIKTQDIKVIDVGDSAVNFLNNAFDNNTDTWSLIPDTFSRIDCARESEESEVVAEIATAHARDGKSVLIVTPDAAANQRLYESFARRGMPADFSGGTTGAAHPVGRGILNLIDSNQLPVTSCQLFDDIVGHWSLVTGHYDEDTVTIFESIKNLSDILALHGIELSRGDIAPVVKMALDGVQIRPPVRDDCLINIMGTMESRMQTADVVILTGLNEGMFPAMGYENPWLPRRIADEIGLPPPERKVSLMALDFINLSCAPHVYWTRAKMSGGTEQVESRFLSRVDVRSSKFENNDNNTTIELRTSNIDWLNRVRAIDNIEYNPIHEMSPAPSVAAFPETLSMTAIELLIHNPYAFYARYILGLKIPDKLDTEPGAKEFGILVHEFIEQRAKSKEQRAETADEIISDLNERAKNILPADSVLLHFWNKRFTEMAPFILELINEIKNKNGAVESDLHGEIAGRKIYARADAIIDDTVIDIKTGAAPTKSRLMDGNMPQIPLSANMSGASTAKFLQLQNNNAKWIEYSGDELQSMIDAAVQKTRELIGQYTGADAAYEWRENTDAKYKEYDDLARK